MKTCWDYRIVKFRNDYIRKYIPSAEIYYYRIMEVHYLDGEITEMYNVPDITSPTLKDIAGEIKLIEKALKKAILNKDH